MNQGEMSLIQSNLHAVVVKMLMVIAVIAAATHSNAQNAEVLITAPPGLENQEGDTSFATGPPPPDGLRSQVVYPPSEFAGLPEGHNTITSMSWRPNFLLGAHEAILDLELRLSTTDAGPGALNDTFANNIGPDETLVYSGVIILATNGAGEPNGPRPFDYLIKFQEPFPYDPSPGNNLLVDVTIRPLSTGKSPST